MTTPTRSNPKDALQPSPMHNLTHLDKNKENIHPKPPDKTIASPGVKIHSHVLLAGHKTKSKEPSATLPQEIIESISRQLNSDGTAMETSPSGDDDEFVHGPPGMDQ